MEHTNSIVRVVGGSVMAVVAIAVLAAGAVLVGAHATQRDGAGYYTSAHNHLSTSARAFVSSGLDVHVGDAPKWMLRDSRLGTLRVTASGTHAKPVFVGVARTDQVNAYLRGVDRELISDFELEPFSVDAKRQPGSVRPTPPASRSFWAASAVGSGEQMVHWPVEKGDWSVVIMNADGSAGIATKISVGAKLGLVLWSGIGVVAFGAVLLTAGIVAIAAGRRSRFTVA